MPYVENWLQKVTAALVCSSSCSRLGASLKKVETEESTSARKENKTDIAHTGVTLKKKKKENSTYY